MPYVLTQKPAPAKAPHMAFVSTAAYTSLVMSKLQIAGREVHSVTLHNARRR
jgi:hypothetical protein